MLSQSSTGFKTSLVADKDFFAGSTGERKNLYPASNAEPIETLSSCPIDKSGNRRSE